MSSYSTEKNFIIAEGEEGQLYIFIAAKKETPRAPYIIYDGKDHAVFVRNDEQKIILDYINPEIRDRLRKCSQVVVIETIMENIKDCYQVDLNMVENIPVDWGQIGLTTWEEASLN